MLLSLSLPGQSAMPWWKMLWIFVVWLQYCFLPIALCLISWINGINYHMSLNSLFICLYVSLYWYSDFNFYKLSTQPCITRSNRIFQALYTSTMLPQHRSFLSVFFLHTWQSVLLISYPTWPLTWANKPWSLKKFRFWKMLKKTGNLG